jgi:4-amino-4-deoxy-L-arabinose transferase-like glycosyltransferase
MYNIDDTKNSFGYEFLYKILLIILIINSCLWIMSPIPDDGDSYLYANIVKELANSNNWYALTYHGKDWLDKPHLPFWIGAICFKLFGSNMIAYNLSGFIFYLIGGYFCAKLAKELYNKEVAWIATIIYFSITRIAISAIYVRAEIFLLAELTATAYFAWKYEKSEQINIKDLLGFSFFSALAIMTKGIFILISIFVSLFVLWVIKKQYFKWLSPKYLLSYLMIAFFTIPEILALYLQFDSHPEKTIEIVGNLYQNISGIKWFFWGSQFGRFFNNGYIIHDIPVGGGYFYFIPVFLEFFMPWSLVFICAIMHYRKFTAEYSYLLASFLILFLLFSISKFQASLYITILFAFPAIICANFLASITESKIVKLIKLHHILLLALLGVLPFAFLAISLNRAICIAIGLIVIAIYFIWLTIRKNNIPNICKLIILCTIIFTVLYNSMMVIKNTFFMQHNIGREVAQSLILDRDHDIKQELPIFYYGIDSSMIVNELLFNTDRQIIPLTEMYDIRSMNMLHFYLLTTTSSEQKVIATFPQVSVIARYEISRFHGLHRTEHQLVTLFRI